MFKGLNSSDIDKLRDKYGYNELEEKKKESIFTKILSVIKEPMFMLLIICSIIYFLLGEVRDGLIMLAFVIGIISIDIIQEVKTDNALNKLKDLSSPKSKVIRDDKEIIISSSELLPGDLLIIHEGVKIPIDGTIIKCNGLKVDESTLTGESVIIDKSVETSNGHYKINKVYSGTLVVGGSAYIIVDSIGSDTELGNIGSSLNNISKNKSKLEKEIGNIIFYCAMLAFLLCLILIIITFIFSSEKNISTRIISSILSGITLAMAMIPEEFPVVLTVFLSMGASRLAKNHSLVKKLSSVETLGSVSVLCVDKTGTITQNKMSVNNVICFNKDEEFVSEIMGQCCLEDTFDPMEKALLNYCKKIGINKKHIYDGNLIKMYPFDDENKMLGMVWNHENETFLALKGSLENILKLTKSTKEEKENIKNISLSLEKNGERVIAIGYKKINKKAIKEKLTDYSVDIIGLVGLIDPPRVNIESDIKTCLKAGIRVMMITGDSETTALTIANSVGINTNNNCLSGNEIENMSDDELKNELRYTNVFSRVLPKHKMRIVNILKQLGNTVAMTGDGVNDAPALKSADIGISMGLRGTEVSKEASDLILTDDNFTTIINSIKDGRRIYDNIKKAIGYIFTIHVPVLLCSLIPPILGLSSNNLFLLPIHILLLELIIDPTSSIVLERIPEESTVMSRKPRSKKESLVTKKSLFISLMQGIFIFIASFTLFLINYKDNVILARTMGLLCIVISNIFLVFVNASSSEYIFKYVKELIKDKAIKIIIFSMCIISLILIYSPLNKTFKLSSLTINQLLLVILLSFISVIWIEIIKIFFKLFANK